MENQVSESQSVLGTSKKHNLNFGQAIELLKEGHSLARAGWNGKKMCIYLNRGSIDGNTLINDKPMRQCVIPETTIDGVGAFLFDEGAQGTVTRLPNINMISATGSTVTGWLASQTDILAEDWSVIEPWYDKKLLDAINKSER